MERVCRLVPCIQNKRNNIPGASFHWARCIRFQPIQSVQHKDTINSVGTCVTLGVYLSQKSFQQFEIACLPYHNDSTQGWTPAGKFPFPTHSDKIIEMLYNISWVTRKKSEGVRGGGFFCFWWNTWSPWFMEQVVKQYHFKVSPRPKQRPHR